MKLLTPGSILGLGNVLEVNILGEQKVCSFDCVYCNLGPTAKRLGKIKESVDFPIADHIVTSVAHELSSRRQQPKQQTMLFGLLISGNGEPTLHPDFENIMKGLVATRNELMPTLKILVMTNGDSLDDREIVRALNLADERIVKLDVATEDSFRSFNKPLSRTKLEKVIRGAKQLKDCIVQAAVSSIPDALNSKHLDDWLEVVGLIAPKNVYLHSVDIEGQTTDRDEVLRVAHLLERRAKFKALLSSENVA